MKTHTTSTLIRQSFVVMFTTFVSLLEETEVIFFFFKSQISLL